MNSPSIRHGFIATVTLLAALHAGCGGMTAAVQPGAVAPATEPARTVGWPETQTKAGAVPLPSRDFDYDL